MRNGTRMMVGATVAGAAMVMAGVGAMVGTAGDTAGSVAGPPIVCHPFEIRGVESLPWGSGAFQSKRGYDTKKLVGQTVECLDGQVSTIARMETLRRAAVYVDGNRDLGLELLSRLCWRAMDAEAAGKPDAAAWFDAAFLVACYEEMGPNVIGKAGIAESVPAYAWMQRAVKLDEADGQIDAGMRLGAALMVHPMMRESRDGLYAVHLACALDAAEEGSIEAANVRAEIKRWDETPASIRRTAERQHAGRGG